jgi:hypothetical protein
LARRVLFKISLATARSPKAADLIDRLLRILGKKDLLNQNLPYNSWTVSPTGIVSFCDGVANCAG